MSDTETKTVRAKPVRDFQDAGTDRSFTAGKAVELTEGEFENFKAAGLVEAEATDAAATDGASAPAARRR